MYVRTVRSVLREYVGAMCMPPRDSVLQIATPPPSRLLRRRDPAAAATPPLTPGIRALCPVSGRVGWSHLPISKGTPVTATKNRRRPDVWRAVRYAPGDQVVVARPIPPVCPPDNAD